MKHVKDEKLQLGKSDWTLGDLPNLILDAMSGIASRKRPKCGAVGL